MTVVTALITCAATAHATDSLITIKQPDGSLKPDEWEKPKVVEVNAFRGAMAYWGLATKKDADWSTLHWMKRMAGRAKENGNAESFAFHIAKDLEEQLNILELPNDPQRGIGIHFTAYERVRDYWIPELFQISNWADSSYRSVNPNGISVTRETFSTITRIPKELCTADECQRLIVHQFLQTGQWLWFNNGDPILFNPAANALMQMYETLSKRNGIKSLDDPATTKALALNPINFVVEAQRAFCKKGTICVGGRPHVLCVTPCGLYI